MRLGKTDWRKALGLGAAAVVILASTAHALTDVLSLHGTLSLRDYGGFYQKDFPHYTGPAVVYMSEAKFEPGDASPWHWHEGLAHVILQQGTAVFDDGCGRTKTYHAGDAWVERPHDVHRIRNAGSGEMILYWSTMYPAKSSALIPAKAPSCP